MMFTLHYPDLMSVYCDVSYKLLLPGGLTTLLEVSAYTCDAQTEERWRVGGWEVFCFGNILIKVGSFYHRLISIGEKGEGQELRGERGGKGMQTQTTRGLKKRSTGSFSFMSCVDCLRCSFASSFLSCIYLFIYFLVFTKCFCLFLSPWRPPSLDFLALGEQRSGRLSRGEGHHLVTRHLLQIPLQGDLASTVAAFGISTVNTCWRCLSPAYTWLHKKTLYLERGHVLQCCD